MKSVIIRRWGIMLCLLFVVQILNGYSVKAGEREKDVEAYYAVVDELNEKYNSEITMPSITEFVNSKLYQLNVEEFRREIEEEFLQVNALNQEDVEIKIVESDFVFYSSGQKTQWCYMNDSSNNKVGALYLTANVVEAGVNQYTSVVRTGVSLQTTCDVYFYGDKSSYSLSGDYKSCTVNYSGWFKNTSGITLTTYKTYTVTYKANAGNYTMYIPKIV